MISCQNVKCDMYSNRHSSGCLRWDTHGLKEDCNYKSNESFSVNNDFIRLLPLFLSLVEDYIKSVKKCDGGYSNTLYLFNLRERSEILAKIRILQESLREKNQSKEVDKKSNNFS